jgi:hypothetical protein
VALALGVAPLSLYKCFVRKEQVVEMLTEALGAQLVDDIAHRTWQEELAHICQNVRCMLLESPRRLPLLSRWVATFPRPEVRRLLDAMMANGTPEAEAVHTLMDAGMLALNLAAREISSRTPVRREATRTSGTWLRDEGFELAIQSYLSKAR